MIGRKPIFIHYVHDMNRVMSFYRSVFEVETKVDTPGWSELDFVTFRLALHILSPGVVDEAPLPHAGLNIEVDEIEMMQARIEASGGKMLKLLEARPRIPDRVATFVDTEGNGFELRQFVGLKSAT